MAKKIPATLLAALAVAPVVQAGHQTAVEEILITGERFDRRRLLTVEPSATAAVDAGELLRTLAGADVNRNGPVTPIAQYRGLYGARVAVSLDRAPALSGGPNAMDAPLGQLPPLLIESLVLERGIAPVASAQETLGGALSASLARGNFAPSGPWQLSGAVNARYTENDHGSHQALRATLANKSHRLTLLSAHDDGNDGEAGGGVDLTGSRYRRDFQDLSYSHRSGDSTLIAHGGRLHTRNTGTPALPMDIRSIETDSAGLDLDRTAGDLGLSLHLAWHDVWHEMDNFSLRRPPATAAGHRLTEAAADNLSWTLAVRRPWRGGHWQAGFDGNLTDHDATVLNPDNPAFAIANFSSAERDTIGVFWQADIPLGEWFVHGGLRLNRVTMDSAEVSARGLPAMMAMGAAKLAGDFNRSDRSSRFHHVDVVVRADYRVIDRLVIQLGAAQKTRAPSYQERYLWLPMAATGGLADGRNYLSNPDIDSEISRELLLGLEWRNGTFWLAPQVFYKRIDDYIQGIPATDPVANAISTMMSGRPALLFDNIDAELIGFDMPWGFELDGHWSVEGALAYVRGHRRDKDDNLYRIPPLNNRISLIWDDGRTRAQLESVLYAQQNDVADFNGETTTAGHGRINVRLSHRWRPGLTLSAAVDNLFDNQWRDHLAGYNRNGANPSVAVGERLPGRGRSLSVGLQWQW